MAYPNSASTFTRVHNYLDLVLETQINPIYTDLEAIESDLIGNSVSANLKAPNIVSGSFIQGTAPFAGGLVARLNNMDAGLYETYNNRVYANGLGAINTLPANIATTPLAIRGAGSSATLTNVTTTGSLITYTGANNFVAGQLVTISNVVSSTTYASFSATTAGNGSQSSLSPITFTGTHGIAAAQLPARASIVIGSQSAVTGTLSYFDATHLNFVQDGPLKKVAYVTTITGTSGGPTVNVTDGSYIAQGMTLTILTGTGTLTSGLVNNVTGNVVTLNGNLTGANLNGVGVFYWASTSTVITLTSLFNLTNATIAASPAPTNSSFSVTSSQAPSGTTYTSGGTAVSKTNSTGLTDWKTYDGTTATTVASIDTSGTFIGALNGGTAASTYNN